MNNSNKIILSKNLVYYMENNNIDRNKLCKDLGLKYSTVSEWISAKKYPRIDKIEILANYFGINKSDLIEEQLMTPNPDSPPEPQEPAEHELSKNEREMIEIFKDLTETQQGELIGRAKVMQEHNRTEAEALEKENAS